VHGRGCLVLSELFSRAHACRSSNFNQDFIYISYSSTMLMLVIRKISIQIASCMARREPLEWFFRGITLRVA
jgi:hypothetical protein